MQSLSLSQDEDHYNDVMVVKPYQDATQSSINNTKHHQEFFEVLNQNTMTLTMHEKLGADFQEISMLHKLEEDYEKRLRSLEDLIAFRLTE